MVVRSARSARSSPPRLAAPRAPVSPGRDEIAQCRTRLLERGLAVAEQQPLARAQLKEPEVLTVARPSLESRLAACDGNSVPAVLAENAADDGLRGRRTHRGKATDLLPLHDRGPRRGDPPSHDELVASVRLKLAGRLALEARIAQQPAMSLEESDHLPVVAQGPEVAP